MSAEPIRSLLTREEITEYTTVRGERKMEIKIRPDARENQEWFLARNPRWPR